MHSCRSSVDCSWKQVSLPFTMLVQLQVVQCHACTLHSPNVINTHHMYPCMSHDVVDLKFGLLQMMTKMSQRHFTYVIHLKVPPLSSLHHYDIICVQGSSITEPLIIHEPHKFSPIPSTTTTTTSASTTRTRSCRRYVYSLYSGPPPSV